MVVPSGDAYAGRRGGGHGGCRGDRGARGGSSLSGNGSISGKVGSRQTPVGGGHRCQGQPKGLGADIRHGGGARQGDGIRGGAARMDRACHGKEGAGGRVQDCCVQCTEGSHGADRGKGTAREYHGLFCCT